MKDNYVLVRWPDSQNYMEESWFREEAILALGSEEKTGSSAYFIPLNRYIESLPEENQIKHWEIRNLVKELSNLYPITEEDKKFNEAEWNQGFPFEGGMNIHESIVNIKLNLLGE